MKRTIIVLSGKQLSGKDALTSILLKKKPDFKRIGIGDAIKIEYGKQKGLTFEQIEQDKHLYRADLIELGNKGRAIDDFYWLNKIIEMDGNIIVPDIRVPRELEILKNNGAISIRVNSTQEQRAKRGNLVNENDYTETALDEITDWDFVIENNGTYEELAAKADVLIANL